MQNEEMITKPRSRVSENGSIGQEVSGYLGHEPKQFFDTSFLQDASLWYGKQQEKKHTEISEIIGILRMTKLQQCRGKYHDHGKFCALGAIMHEKYGWNGFDYPFEHKSFAHQYLVKVSAQRHLVRILGDVILHKIMSLNDHEGKSFSEIADWLEKNYLNTEPNSTLYERNVTVVLKKSVKIEILIMVLDRHIERLEATLSFLNASYNPHNDLLYAHEEKVNAAKQEIQFVEKQRQKLKKLKEIGNEYVNDLLEYI
jgi:hypothetical protein